MAQNKVERKGNKVQGARQMTTTRWVIEMLSVWKSNLSTAVSLFESVGCVPLSEIHPAERAFMNEYQEKLLVVAVVVKAAAILVPVIFPGKMSVCVRLSAFVRLSFGQETRSSPLAPTLRATTPCPKARFVHFFCRLEASSVLRETWLLKSRR